MSIEPGPFSRPLFSPEGSSTGTLLLVPVGAAWPAVLRIVVQGLDRLLPEQTGLLLGSVEGWVRGVLWETPQPPGIHDAGRIAYALRDQLTGYRQRSVAARSAVGWIVLLGSRVRILGNLASKT
jgi:hypothetical protein